MFLYFPITIFCGCVAIFICCCVDSLDIKFQEYDAVYRNIKLYILLACPLYLFVLMVISAMACSYLDQADGNQWWENTYICAYDGIIATKGYCDTFTIQWTDWRAIILFLSWILF